MLGHSVELNCSVTSVTTLETCAVWMFNDTIIPSLFFVSDSKCIETRTLQLINVTMEDSGNYTCMCHQSRSSTIERTIEVKIIEPES